MKGWFTVGKRGKARDINKMSVPDARYEPRMKIYLWGPDDVLEIVLDRKSALDLAESIVRSVGINKQEASNA